MKNFWFRAFSLAMILALTLSLLPLTGTQVQAAGGVSLTVLGSAYTQNFDTLASSGTSSLVPDGWSFFEAGTNANTLYTAGTGSGNAGDTYSFGNSGSPERAFGGLQSGSLIPIIGASFTNNAGKITSLAISYTGEQWRLGTSGRGADRLDFQYSTNATSLSSGTWTDVNELDFSSPVTVGTVGALNGNASANRTVINATLSGLNITAGTTFWIRWTDFNVTNSDDGLAVDDFSLTPFGVPTNPAPFVSSTSPAGNDSNVLLTSNITVNFSEPVTVTGDWFAIACTISGAHTATVSGGPSSFTLNPDADFANSETCTVTVTTAQVVDQDANDPANMTADYTFSFIVIGPDLAPEVASTVPANGATNVPINQSITVNFTEPVNVTDPWFSLSCATSGAHSAAVSGGPSSYILNPTTDFVYGEACTLTIDAANVSDQDNNDPPDNMVVNFIAGFTTQPDPCTLPFTPTYSIQGSGAAAAITGSVTTQGVVVGDYEGASPALRGFFIEDPTGDSNPATSDGLFVFESSNANTVSVGDVVRVTGNAGENQGQTQISVGSIIKCGSGTVAPVDVTLPVTSADDLERYEGMLVRFPQPLYVTEHFQLGRFGQVVLSANDRLKQPTNVVAPGAPAAALQAQNDLDKIILDDASQAQNPDPIVFGRGGQPLSAANTLRGGDFATNIVGVMTYTWAGNAASGNAYRLRPINALGGSTPNFQPANPRPASPNGPNGRLRVVGMNLLNFFNTFADGNAATPGCYPSGKETDCRGATSQAEFDRQWPKTVAAMVKMNPDVVGINELENDGYGPDSAIQFLVDQLNAAQPDTYAFINPDAATGQDHSMGGDAIRVGVLYKTSTVTPVGTTAVLNTPDFVNGGDSAPRNRATLAQAFKEISSGEVFIVSPNHLKSKGSACDKPDALDGQSNCAVVRMNAANTLADWLATDPTGTGDPDRLIIGDLNSYAKEDTLTALQNKGYTNLIQRFVGADAYSYVFDGQWGYLDHALGSDGIQDQVAGVVEYHINSDEPSVLDYNTDFKSAGQLVSLYAPDQYRISDHDPVIIGLNLNTAPTVGAISAPIDPVLVNTPLNASANFTDPTINDVETAVWDWGDGSTSAGAVTYATGGGSVSGSHGYSAAGVYEVTLTVTDKAGGVGSSTLQYVVIYDTNGGFVTGGGWIDSPVGAYIADPSLTGMANFGFVSKYLKGTSVPAGNTEFDFKAGSMDFHSTDYQWLVISGAKAQYKGTGTINGAGSYGFMLTAIDGQLNGGGGTDKLRVKIWDIASGAIVYDNLMGGADTATPTTVIGGGSIVIHK